MIGYINLLTDGIISFLDYLDEILINKPLVSIAFPTSGLLSTFIPDNILGVVSPANPVRELIDASTPYLKFLFLILTLLLSIVSFILQVKKLYNKDKNE